MPAPKPPRAPRLRPPRPPSPPRLSPPTGRLRLSEPRDRESRELDARAEVPFLRWDQFVARYARKFKQGEHITIVGTTGSGKTVLARELLTHDYTAVLGTKNEDRELYGPFQDRGFEIVPNFDPEPDPEESRIIFRPRITTPDDRGLSRQRDRFETMLFEVWEYGGWELYADEIWYLTNKLKLATTFELFWTAGRSADITLVASTQLPVSIPVMAFDQATHLFLFRNTDQYRIKRMAEFGGADSKTLRGLIPLLPRHEFVYVDTREGTMVRSKVALG